MIDKTGAAVAASVPWKCLAFLVFVSYLGPVPAPAAERWMIQYFYDKNDSALQISDFQFASPEFGIAVGFIDEVKHRKPVAVITRDGGVHWALESLHDTATTVFFLNPQTGWLVSEKGRLWETTDGARSWSPVSLVGVHANAQSVFFINESRGWLLCGKKQVFVTNDGGHSWQLLQESTRPDLPESESLYSDAAFLHSGAGILAGWGRMSNPRSTGLPIGEAEMFPLGRAAAGAFVLRTPDSGGSWTMRAYPNLGEVIRARVSPDGRPFLVIHHPGSLRQVGAILFALSPETLQGETIYSDSSYWITDVAFSKAGRTIVGGIDQEGRSPFPLIPSRLKLISSPDLKEWSNMAVDYRAEARDVILAVPDPDHAWLATDTGMILKLVDR